MKLGDEATEASKLEGARKDILDRVAATDLDDQPIREDIERIIRAARNLERLATHRFIQDKLVRKSSPFTVWVSEIMDALKTRGGYRG